MNKILAMNLKINFDIKVKKKQHYRYIFSINHLITTHTCRPYLYLLHQSINKKKNSAMNVKINFDIKRGEKKPLYAPPTISIQLIRHVFTHYIGQ